MQEIIYIKYEIQGKLYKNESNWDFYFDLDNDYLAIVRSCIPIKSTGNNYFFIHKSIQEFLAASNFVDEIREIYFSD